MRSVLLTQGVPARKCEKCGSVWIAPDQYLSWLRTHQGQKPEATGERLPPLAVDSPKAKLCPECGHILVRSRVCPDIERYLENCGHCNGVWLDRGEWEVLVSRNLHDQVNLFFTDSWQNKLRKAEMRRSLERLYIDRFGSEDYARLKELKDWIDRHPEKDSLIAYLQAEDPYQL